MKKIVCFLLAVSGFMVGAQDYPRKNIDASRIADELFGFQDLDLNYEALYENILQLLANPIDLNKATEEDLRFLNILSEAQVQNFIKYRAENGNLLSVYELQAITGFDMTTIYKLIPFVKVNDPFSALSTSLFTRALHQEDNYFIMRYEQSLEPKRGFSAETDSQHRFKGSDDNVYFRFRSSRPGDFSFGFTAEKDAGEQFQWNPSSRQYGFDYVSFHAQLQNKGRLKNLIVGDYQAQFGQGLALGGIFGMGKGAETISTTRRSNIGLLPYTSINEAGSLHGVGVTYSLSNHVTFTGLYSNTFRDATVAGGDTLDATTTSSLQITGLHRNDAELEKRKRVRQTNYGGVLNYKYKSLDAGVIFSAMELSVPFDRTPTLYNQFAFNGKQNQNAGAFLNYTAHNATFFGEFSQSIRAGKGLVLGMIASLTNHLDMSVVYRKYDPNFYSFYSNGFSENTNPQNESGIYWGWKYAWNRKISFNGYFDMFHFPWLRYRSYAPSDGHEWLGRLTYQPSKKVMIFVQVREEVKVRNVDRSPNLYTTAAGTKRNYWINLEYGVTQTMRMKTRAQFSSYDIDNMITHGLAVIQDVNLDVGKFGITARYVLFDTDDYDNRQYVYEQDVWLAYTFPAYYGVGVRTFVLLEYKINRNLSVWLRYGHTRYTDRSTIGSGVDAIDGNTKNDVKFQLRLRL